MKVFLLLAFAALASSRSFEDVVKENVKTEGKHWGLLVAGSKTWMNYRHQADICHAFHVLKNNGIPEENIVVMMYDDIANNRDNPTKGTIINHPNGKDVYSGVPKDYTGRHVTPTNFLNIMQGRKELMVDENGQTIGSGKVINSGPNDHIFVNFVDHGGPGSVAFPSELLHAKNWNKAIKQMHAEKKYGQMVIYLEACESGSMFDKLLPSNINVFVTTASNPHQSSYAVYYDKKRRTYLGDLYSVNWMENSDKGLATKTLEEQYKIVKQKTNRSQVQQYGDMEISKEKVSAFQGDTSTVSPSDVPIITYPTVQMDAVPSPDVPLAVLRHRLTEAKTRAEEDTIVTEIKAELSSRQHIATVFQKILTEVLKDNPERVEELLSERWDLVDHDCYASVVDHFNDNCMNVAQNDRALRHLFTLVNLCETGHVSDVINQAMDKVCRQ